MVYMSAFNFGFLKQGIILMREDPKSTRLEEIYVDLHKLLGKKENQVCMSISSMSLIMYIRTCFAKVFTYMYMLVYIYVHVTKYMYLRTEY